MEKKTKKEQGMQNCPSKNGLRIGDKCGEIFAIWPFFETFFCKKTPDETIFKNRPFFGVM